MQSKTGHLKTSSGKVISDKAKQMERWVEHYSDLYSRENIIVTSALDAINSLSIMEELDAEPIQEELSKAIDNLACGKAPENDDIPPDLIRYCKTTLLQPLHDTLCQCWSESGVPQDMRDAKITLYKNKGDRSDCNNYRGISPLSIVGKLYARVFLVHIQQLAERIYPESQCGFRAESSAVDMIFSLHQIQKCREQQKPLYIAFIDLTKAFDLVMTTCDAEIKKCIGKAAKTLGQLTTRVWEIPKLTTPTKMAVYNACIFSTLLYRSESWIIYAKQEQKLNSFHMRCVRCILGISWNDKVPNAQVLARAVLPTMYTLLRQCRLRWFGHVHRMEDGRIPKDIFYFELHFASGKRLQGGPQLKYKDVCKYDMKALDISTEIWEDTAANHSSWRCFLKKQPGDRQVRIS
ncbi:hypothetical protein AOLI_G00268120 [Acnodon oligacanthus]